MTVRKYLFSPRVVTGVLGVVPVALATRKRPLGLRVGVAWIAWAGGLALAIATVRQESARRRTT